MVEFPPTALEQIKGKVCQERKEHVEFVWFLFFLSCVILGLWEERRGREGYRRDILEFSLRQNSFINHFMFQKYFLDMTFQ